MRRLASISVGLCAVALLAQGALAQQSLKPLDKYGAGYDVGNSVFQSVERLKPPDRSAIKEIISELKNKSIEDITLLKLSQDICQDIACRGASPELVRSYVQAQKQLKEVHGLRAAAWEPRYYPLMVSFASFRRSRPK